MMKVMTAVTAAFTVAIFAGSSHPAWRTNTHPGPQKMFRGLFSGVVSGHEKQQADAKSWCNLGVEANAHFFKWSQTM